MLAPLKKMLQTMVVDDVSGFVELQHVRDTDLDVHSNVELATASCITCGPQRHATHALVMLDLRIH